jgi:hypothetical protein
MIKNRLLFAAICLIGLSFQQVKLETTDGTPFFNDYKQVLHFKYIISKTDANNYLYSKGEKKKEYPDCLTDRLPQKLDANLAEKLFHEGFIRNKIKKKEFQNLDQIFSYRNTDQAPVAECLPIYRDILIFRNKKEVKGIVQICFDCSQFMFIGSNVETFGFGQEGEPAQLKALLYPD